MKEKDWSLFSTEPFQPCRPKQIPWQTVWIQNLHSLPFYPSFLTKIPICRNEYVQIQSWKSPLQNFQRGEKDKADIDEAFLFFKYILQGSIVQS